MEKLLTVEEFYSIQKTLIENALKTPCKFMYSNKYTKTSAYIFKSEEHARNFAVEEISKYLDTVEKVTDKYIKGTKYNHTLTFEIETYSREHELKEELEELENNYNYYKNFQEQFKGLLEKFELTGYYSMGSRCANSNFDGDKYYYMHFLNPITREERNFTYCDEDDRCTDEYNKRMSINSELRACPTCIILEQVERHNKNIISRNKRHEEQELCVNDIVKIVKGRKLPIGLYKVIDKFEDYTDRYNRYVCTYAIFTDNTKTNMNNCELAQAVTYREYLENNYTKQI